jgi:hypothetical protein
MNFGEECAGSDAALNHSTFIGAKKTGRRKLNSPPGLKLLVRNYERAP